MNGYEFELKKNGVAANYLFYVIFASKWVELTLVFIIPSKLLRMYLG